MLKVLLSLERALFAQLLPNFADGFSFYRHYCINVQFHADYNATPLPPHPEDTNLAGQVCLICSNTQALNILNECPALEKLQSLQAILRSIST